MQIGLTKSFLIFRLSLYQGVDLPMLERWISGCAWAFFPQGRLRRHSLPDPPVWSGSVEDLFVGCEGGRPISSGCMGNIRFPCLQKEYFVVPYSKVLSYCLYKNGSANADTSVATKNSWEDNKIGENWVEAILAYHLGQIFIFKLQN